jgi:hypothetical protein
MAHTSLNEVEVYNENVELQHDIQKNGEKPILMSEEEFVHQEDWSNEDISEFEEEYSNEADVRDFSQNQIQLNFSWSLTNQLRYLARNEGISVEDLLVELVAEGVTKRAFEDQNKPVPSHLMTRNGYVHGNADGNSMHSQPQMSHHQAMQNNSRSGNGQAGSRGKSSTQQRNQQFNGSRYQRNYQNNSRNGQQSNGRQNYNSQQRFSRSSANANQANSRFENDSNFQSNKSKKY